MRRRRGRTRASLVSRINRSNKQDAYFLDKNSWMWQSPRASQSSRDPNHVARNECGKNLFSPHSALQLATCLGLTTGRSAWSRRRTGRPTWSRRSGRSRWQPAWSWWQLAWCWWLLAWSWWLLARRWWFAAAIRITATTAAATTAALALSFLSGRQYPEAIISALSNSTAQYFLRLIWISHRHRSSNTVADPRLAIRAGGLAPAASLSELAVSALAACLSELAVSAPAVCPLEPAAWSRRLACRCRRPGSRWLPVGAGGLGAGGLPVGAGGLGAGGLPVGAGGLGAGGLPVGAGGLGAGGLPVGAGGPEPVACLPEQLYRTGGLISGLLFQGQEA